MSASFHATQLGREYVSCEARCVADPEDENYRSLYRAVLAFETGKPSGLRYRTLLGEELETIPMTSWEMRFPDPADLSAPIELVAHFGEEPPRRRRRRKRA